MRKKMPRKPMYGELEVGETFPSQRAKKKKAKTTAKTKAKVKTVGFGKKAGGGVKSAMEIRREKQRKILESMD